jgi:hypothetical protein
MRGNARRSNTLNPYIVRREDARDGQRALFILPTPNLYECGQKGTGLVPVRERRIEGMLTMDIDLKKDQRNRFTVHHIYKGHLHGQYHQ